MKAVWFDPRAEEEFLLSAQYYEDQESGLGARFIAAVKVAVRVAASSPQIHRKILLDCRKCRVVRFPYALIFRERNDELQIVAVMHMKRKPERLDRTALSAC
jgi:plasmid stabilization system protein ParE